ncbi:MAG: 4-hydroxyphenyl-beta-ketoacyl-CoA hydrolase [Anaerolineales bacterium]
MIVDVHVHVHRPEVAACRDEFCARDAYFQRLYADPKARLATAEDVIQAMDDDGVDVAVICGFAWRDAGICRDDNDYVMEAVARYPRRLVGLAVLNPCDGDRAVYEMERCARGGLRGLGELMPDGQGYALSDVEAMRPIMEAARMLGWVVLTHSNEQVGHDYAGKGKTGPEVVLRFAQAFPDARIVCAHWGGGLLFYELMPEVRESLRNVFYDTAASPYLYDDRIFRVAAEIAPEKVLFGTDYPLLRARTYLKRVRAVGLSPEVERAMLGGNAARVFGIGEGYGR